MTLIMSMNFGELITVMTSDTRKVTRNALTGATLNKFTSDKSKIERLSPYCIYGGGGADVIVDKIKHELKKSAAVHIEDFIEPFKACVVSLREDSTYRWRLNDEEQAQIMITGFNSDNSLGMISFMTGSDSEVEYRILPYHSTFQVIAPSVDEVVAAAEHVKFPQPANYSEYVESTVTYLSDVQRAFYLNDSDTVSEICDYIVIYRDPHTGEFSCFEDTINLIE